MNIADIRSRQEAIEMIKFHFKNSLSSKLKLLRISAPHFIESGKGLQDGLTGIEQPVGFYIPAANKHVEVPHSLAKWKREAIQKYNIQQGEGIIVDGAYFRPEEPELDATHSVFVDQWDWEIAMAEGQRNQKYLEKVVAQIHEAMLETQEELLRAFPKLDRNIDEKLKFVTMREMGNMTEKDLVKQHPFVFIRGIDEPRAPDYDSWIDELNGDIVAYHPPIDGELELSSMGIRVNSDTLLQQCNIKGMNPDQEYHKRVLKNELPQTIGGGIGQSRLAMLILGARHIGEVQASVHSDETNKWAEREGIALL
ncbi:MAG: aspartate--ammonia ligase [Firmicutes bacterium]|nr:aspartate--ammonia ligase [Bacillota bacterium]